MVDSTEVRTRGVGAEEGNGTAPDGGAARPPNVQEDGTGLENFAIPDDAARAASVETVAVEIASGASVPLVLAARAGARAVVLDTLRAGGRLRIDLVGPRESLEILWETLDGSRSGVVPVPAVGDSVARVPVGPPGGS